jgi:hypothetical protein
MPAPSNLRGPEVEHGSGGAAPGVRKHRRLRRLAWNRTAALVPELVGLSTKYAGHQAIPLSYQIQGIADPSNSTSIDASP